jgi:hypothetical protein
VTILLPILAIHSAVQRARTVVGIVVHRVSAPVRAAGRAAHRAVTDAAGAIRLAVRQAAHDVRAAIARAASAVRGTAVRDRPVAPGSEPRTARADPEEVPAVRTTSVQGSAGAAPPHPRNRPARGANRCSRR